MLDYMSFQNNAKKNVWRRSPSFLFPKQMKSRYEKMGLRHLVMNGTSMWNVKKVCEDQYSGNDLGGSILQLFNHFSKYRQHPRSSKLAKLTTENSCVCYLTTGIALRIYSQRMGSTLHAFGPRY